MSDAVWRIGVVAADGTSVESLPLEAKRSAEVIAATCRECLDRHRYRGEGVVLALPSAWCLSAPVSSDGLPTRSGRRQAAVYRLEERLPLPAEDVTVDFLETGDRLLGVGVETERVAPLLGALEACGVAVEVVCPAVLLVLETLRGRGLLPADGVVVLADADRESDGEKGFDALRLQHGSLLFWRHAHEIASLDTLIATETLRGHSSLSVLVISGDTVNASAFTTGSAAEQLSDPADDLACASAAAALDGGAALIVNLRRDALGGDGSWRSLAGPLQFAGVAAAVALLVATGASLWRTHVYHGIEQSHLARQESLFHDALPGRAAPPSVKLSLESEARRLRGISGIAEIPRDVSRGGPSGWALGTLHEALRRLPTELRFRVLELRIEEGRVLLDGEARSHGDAELVAAALRAQQGFAVDPPRTEQLADRGVAFTLNASYPHSSERAP